jgi:UDP-glucose 4-epimerase
VIPNLLRQANLNGTLVVHGDGVQTRDYVYVDDVVNAMVAAATMPDLNQLIINIGSGSETSVRDLVRLVVEITGGRPEVVFNPRNERGPVRMCANIELARQMLGYQPGVTLEAGLRQTLERDARLK